MDRRIKDVQFCCDKSCSQQINYIIQALDIKLPLLNDDECELIDNRVDKEQMSENDEVDADKLLRKNIMGIFKNAMVAIQKLQSEKRVAGKKQANQDEMLTIINSLSNLADQMPVVYYEEMFVEIKKIIETLHSRAALKFCSTLFSIMFHAHRNAKIEHEAYPDETEEFIENSPRMKDNLLKLYSTWLTVAGASKCLNEVPHTIDDINMFIVEWDLTGKKEEAEIWKMLWVQLKHLTWLGKATFAANANIDRESALVLTEKVMLKMLAAASRVYDVSEQEELSRKCILHALRDKHCFLYDSLLNAKCVQHLQGTPSYRLLEIFTTGTLPDFRQYISTSAGQDFLGELAIAESERLKSQNNKVDKNLIMNFLERKIRQLTFIELAGQCIRKNRYNNGEPNSSESSLNLDQLKEDLDLKDDIAVEEFIIDAIRTNMVKAKLSQSARKVIIHHAVPRQFTRSHWEELAIRLNNWREQITRVNKGFDDIINKTAPEVFRQSIA